MQITNPIEKYPELQKEFLVIGHLLGKAIISNEEGELFTLYCEEESLAPIGSVVEDRFLEPITSDVLEGLEGILNA